MTLGSFTCSPAFSCCFDIKFWFIMLSHIDKTMTDGPTGMPNNGHYVFFVLSLFMMISLLAVFVYVVVLTVRVCIRFF